MKKRLLFSILAILLIGFGFLGITYLSKDKQKDLWPHITKSECYDKNGKLNSNPIKDGEGNIVNCYDKYGSGQGYRLYNNHLLGQSKGYVVDGILVGPFVDYYNNGNKFREGYYYNGELSGHVIVYYENGNIKDDFYVSNYKYYGDRLEYYENGDIKSISHYDDNGCSIGEYIKYYENGQLAIKGNFADECSLRDLRGTEIGDWYHYYENGQLEAINHFENGSLAGDFIEYYDNGHIKQKGSYFYEESGPLSSLSTRHGEYLEYYEDGKIKTRGEYSYGDKVSWFEYDENGEIIGDPIP